MMKKVTVYLDEKYAGADCFVCDQATCPKRDGKPVPYEEVGE